MRPRCFILKQLYQLWYQIVRIIPPNQVNLWHFISIFKNQPLRNWHLPLFILCNSIRADSEAHTPFLIIFHEHSYIRLISLSIWTSSSNRVYYSFRNEPFTKEWRWCKWKKNPVHPFLSCDWEWKMFLCYGVSQLVALHPGKDLKPWFRSRVMNNVLLWM
jgi:hypothetical protein